MYQKPIYTLKSSDENSFLVELSPEHRIFQAHFPGSPVLPGACIIEIFNQLINLNKSHTLSLEHIKQVKFLKMIEPDKTTCVRFCFDSVIPEGENRFMAKASVTSPDRTVLYVKLSATYVIR